MDISRKHITVFSGMTPSIRYHPVAARAKLDHFADAGKMVLQNFSRLSTRNLRPVNCILKTLLLAITQERL